MINWHSWISFEQVAQRGTCIRARQPNAPSPLPGGKQRDTLPALDENDQVKGFTVKLFGGEELRRKSLQKTC